jgi:hypothetical protein
MVGTGVLARHDARILGCRARVSLYDVDRGVRRIRHDPRVERRGLSVVTCEERDRTDGGKSEPT